MRKTAKLPTVADPKGMVISKDASPGPPMYRPVTSRPRFGRSRARSRTRCLKTGLVCYLSSCEKLQKNPACFWNCSTNVIRDITKVGGNHFTMPVRGEKLLHNLQFINKLIKLCSKGRFDIFTEEGNGSYRSSKRCPPRREPSLRKKRAQTRTEEVNHRSLLLETTARPTAGVGERPNREAAAAAHMYMCTIPLPKASPGALMVKRECATTLGDQN